MARKRGQRARRQRASNPEPNHDYTFRRRDQRASYVEPRDPESESESASQHSDSDNSMVKRKRPTRRRRPTSRTPRELKKNERVDSRGDVIARGGQDHGQGVKSRSYSQSAMETDMANSSTDFNARPGQGFGQGGNTTLHSQSAMEIKVAGSNGDLIAKRKQVHGQSQNRRTSCTPGAKENEKVDSSADSIAKRRQGQGHGQVGNTTLSSGSAMEIEMVDSSVDTNSRHRRGGRTTLSTARANDTRIGDSNKDLTAENTESCAQKAKESARRGKSRIQGGNSRSSSARGIDVTARCAQDQGGRGMETRWGIQGTRSRRRAAEGEQSKESANPGPSLILGKGPSSSERQSSSMRTGSPSTKQVRCRKKTILSWLINCNSIKEGEQVCYMDGKKTSPAMAGRVTRGGILCNCCQREISVWAFEKHAGSDLRQPYQHIYIPRKTICLRDCQIGAWQEPEEEKRRSMFSYVPKENAADQNDDACSVCGDGGDLILCDNCPSTYHPSCMNLERVPHNDWLCPYCICKFCGLGGDSKEFITCCQCHKKFHWGCFKEFEKEFLKETLDINCSRLYCGPGCREIYERLEGSLGIRNGLFARYSWRVVRNMDMNHMTPKLFSDARDLQSENNSKVAVTWMLMNEAFKTITDRHTGINVVQSVVYSCGSNLTRVNFSRFYTFVMEKDDEIIAAASIRFHGRGIAEMPFIATDVEHRGQGICKSLMGVIESFLRGLNVENLIIPSIPKTAKMWRRSYSFNDVSKELMREIASFNVLMFNGSIRMCKALSKSTADGGHGVDNKHNQTDIQNCQEPQMEQAERPFLDLNEYPNPEDE